VHTSEDENPELLWGLRGGGGNFGIATSLEYRLHPVGPTVLAGPIFFAGDRAEEVLRFYRDWVRTLPDEMTTLVNLTTAPPAPFLPESVHGKPVVAVLAVHAGEPEQGRALVQPLKDLGDPVADLIDAMPYTVMQSLLDPLWEKGAHNYFRSSYIDEVNDEAVATLVARHGAVPSPNSEIHLHHFGGAVARVGDDESAFGKRSAEYVLNAIARSPEADGFEESVAWARGTTDALAPVSREGAYVNFMGDARDERLRAAYGHAKYERLVDLKRQYDPTNLFRLNQNIVP
jgi:FAD/FMN-containing dehydrogenase